jgi:adenylate cyclase
VRGEAREAADRNVLVPVRFDAAKLPMDVRAIHTIDLDAWGENPASASFVDLKRALGAMMARQRAAQASANGGSAQPATAPAAAASAPRVAVCVLPFSNMSGDLEQEYFSDGISEDIITDLSKVSSLAVVSRNTAFSFKGKNVDLPQVARQLKVTHVLEGSVRRAGGRVRITAQLVEAATDNHVWAERYDRDLNDIFALQDEISQAIVKALRLKLQPEEKKAIEQRGTTNLDAYNLLLMARQHYSTGQASDLRRSDTVIRMARGAIDLDPDYAEAWALLASAQRNRLYSTSQGDNGLEAAVRAIELDGDLAEAHAAKAGVLSSQGDYDAANGEIAIALRLNPESVDVLREAGRLAMVQRRFDEATVHFEKAFALNPVDISSGCLLVTCYSALGDQPRLRDIAQRTSIRAQEAVKTDPGNGSAMGAMCSCLMVIGETERGREWARRAIIMDPENTGMRFNLACDICVFTDDIDLAVDMLEPVFQRAGREQLAWASADPDLDKLRAHPKFVAMIEAANRRLDAQEQQK